MIRNLLTALILAISFATSLTACESGDDDDSPTEHVGDGMTVDSECINDSDCESGICASTEIDPEHFACWPFEDEDGYGSIRETCTRPAKPDYGGEICNSDNPCPESHECRYVTGPYSKCTPRCE